MLRVKTMSVRTHVVLLVCFGAVSMLFYSVQKQCASHVSTCRPG